MSSSDRTESFVKLLAQYDRRIYSYILTLVPNWADAEEVLQETHVILWREFDKFELGTNFLAWAYKIAFHQVLKYRKQKKRDKLQFSDEFLEAVAGETADSGEQLEKRYRLLHDCITKLNDDHREILHHRYKEGASVESVADTVGRTVGALYRVLSRIRRSLHECVTRKLASEGLR